MTAQRNELNTDAHILLFVVINVHKSLPIKITGHFDSFNFHLKRHLPLRMATGYDNQNVNTRS